MACASCQRKKGVENEAASLPPAKPPIDPMQGFNGYRVVLINLKERTDRLANFNALRKQNGWCLPEPECFAAIRGDKVGTPSWFREGGGAYGCWRSHLAILERAIMDDVPGLIVFEDDVDWDQDMNAELGKFLGNVPSDWDALWIGGQLQGVTYDVEKKQRRGVKQAHKVAPGVLRAYSVERTHAYVVRGQKAMRELYKTWARIEVHCDWVLGNWQEKARVYVPEYPMFCQSRSKSDINGRVNPRKCFRPVNGDLPVVLLKAPKHVAQALERYGFHRGYDRDYANTDIDNGLKKCFAISTEKERDSAVKNWIHDLNWECGQSPGLVTTVWHPDATLEQIKRLTKGSVTEIVADSVEAALEQFPMEKLREHSSRPHVVALLRAEKAVAEGLRGLGFHMGNWRDEATAIDKGLLNALKAEKPTEAVRDVYERWLRPEAEAIANGVVCFWHPSVAKEMIEKATNMKVVEIKANSVEDALEQWRMGLTV